MCLDLAQARTRPKLETGLGVVYFQFPHYLGANQYYKGTLPFPLLIYRTDFFEIGQESKLFLLDSESVELDIALNGRAPVESDDEDATPPDDFDNPRAELSRFTNYTRRGMPNLPFALFFGFQLRIFFSDHLVAELPFVNGATVGSGFAAVGNTFEPTLEFRVLGRDSDHSLDFSVNWLYGDHNYNEFYYRVREKHILDDRPLFRPDGGLVAYQYGISTFWELTDRWGFGGTYFFNDMTFSAVRNSPLVISQTSRNFGVVLRYIFYKSSETVQVR